MTTRPPARTMALLLAVGLAGACAAPRPSLLAKGPDWLHAPAGAPPRLDGRHVLFVAGFGNEFIPGYFDDNAAVCEQLGARTSRFYPPAESSLSNDVTLLERELPRWRDRPVVLFGHSKGGAAVLLTVLRHPELVLSGRIDAVIVVQGALGGSPLADGVQDAVDLGDGMHSLRTDQARRVFGEALARLDATLSPEDRHRLFSRVFYVRSAHREGQLGAELALSEALLKPSGANDGLLTPEAMRLERGVDLGELESDHASLTVSSFVSVTTAEERRAFTLALLREVGRHLDWR